MRNGYIYKTTNLVNNKIYIGKSRLPFNPKYFGSGLLIRKAINKYNKKNFKLEVIVYESDKNKLNELEKKYIEEYRLICGEANLYNLSNGGNGGELFLHRKDCLCPSCRTKRGIKINHREGCQCVTCKSKRGEWKHIENCQCCYCKAKRKEWKHRIDCNCCFCRNKRGEFKGINNPRYNPVLHLAEVR